MVTSSAFEQTISGDRAQATSAAADAADEVRSGLPWQRVLGLGTQLDTARFRGYLAKRLQVPATQVNAIILGEQVKPLLG